MTEWRELAADPPGAPSDDDQLSPPRRTRAGGQWRFALEVPFLLVVAALVAIAVKAFLAQAFYIPSASMEPQLTAGDRVVVSRLSYDLHDPRRGDIVVFDDPTRVDDGDEPFLLIRAGREALEAVGVVRPDSKELIKRVIGLPGETVSGRGGLVFVDDRPLLEPYLAEHVVTRDFPAYRVPEGHVFVMGDNRTNSKDSRIFRAVPVDSVVGRAIGRVWPPGRLAFL